MRHLRQAGGTELSEVKGIRRKTKRISLTEHTKITEKFIMAQDLKTKTKRMFHAEHTKITEAYYSCNKICVVDYVDFLFLNRPSTISRTYGAPVAGSPLHFDRQGTTISCYEARDKDKSKKKQKV